METWDDADDQDLLAQVDAAERWDKLSEAYRSVESDYERLLRSLKPRNGDHRPAKRQKSLINV